VNLRLILTALRQKRVSVAAYSVAGLASVVLYVAMFPSLQDQSAAYEEILKTMPPAMLKAFGIEGAGLGGVIDFLASKHFGLVWPLMLVFLAVSQAGWLLAGEVEKGTMSLWLSAPVSRARVFWTRYAAGVIGQAIFIALSVLTVIPVAQAFNLTLKIWPVIEFSLAAGLFGLAVFGLTLVASAIFSDKGKVYGLASGTLLVMYVINLVAQLNDNLADLKYLSLFHYLDVAGILAGHGVGMASWLVLGAAAVVGTALAVSLFVKRDVSV
jgi:ABC-2 type transport system permease protein